MDITASITTLEQVQARLQQLQDLALDGVSGILKLELLSIDLEQQTGTFRACTEGWMKNAAQTLHGGLIATVLDHSMGALLYCTKDGDKFCPTVEMQASYHRPLIPGKTVLVKARVVAKSRKLAHIAAEVFQEDDPNKICASGTSVYFITD